MSPQDAVSEMSAVIKTAWDATGYPIVWDDLPANVPTGATPWARVTVQHDGGGQSSLSDNVGRKRYVATGILAVQVFAPVAAGRTKGYELAYALLRALRMARGSVWYANQRVAEAAASGAFSQINVTAEFNYDDIV